MVTGNWIGHPDAQRRLVDEAWLYATTENQSFAVYLMAFHRVSLADLDAGIEALEARGAPAGAELRERRGRAFNAPHGSADLLRHIEWIQSRLREIRRDTVKTAEIQRLNRRLNNLPGPVMPAGDATKIKPLQRGTAQDAAVIAALIQNGFNPKAVPENLPGKPGAKSAVHGFLSSDTNFAGRTTVFRKTWKRLIKSGEIVYVGRK